MTTICLLSFPAFAEEGQDTYDDYEDGSFTDRYSYDNPFDNKTDKTSPFYTKKTPREDRVKRQRNFKPIELDSGRSRKTRSSEEVINWQMQPYKR